MQNQISNFHPNILQTTYLIQTQICSSDLMPVNCGVSQGSVLGAMA